MSTSIRRILPAVLAALAVFIEPALQTCSSHTDCSLNGICQDNKCICDPGWRADDCGELDVQPTVKYSGLNLSDTGTSTWGSRIIHGPMDKQMFHMFVSEFPGGCGLDYWAPFSRIARAESRTGPLGPYNLVEEVVGAFAHNPTVVFSAKDGLYALYYIGCPMVLPSSCSHMQFTCGKGNDANGESGISLATSPDLRTWTFHGEVFSTGGGGAWDETVINPSAFVLEGGPGSDDSILLAYRGCPYNCHPYPPYGPELISIASASSYAGLYKRVEGGPLFKDENEDPFLWRDKRGNYHMLLHSLEPEGGFGLGPKVGRHAYAASWDGPWTFGSKTLAFNTTAFFTDGTSIDFHRRERPQIFFSEDGEMTPLYMTNGVQEKGKAGSYTLIVPIGQEFKKFEQSLGISEAKHDEL
ncbi:unnamed protein product [Clonostachys byssicola]|uniref:EGF-like domain-containing protein n=1 Tax=Clonostachys byssicola TaxID=160290 RepID=A0A9N9U5T0_9HYPO|nr:unnamed protein product [Clonostachys byssicola]